MIENPPAFWAEVHQSRLAKGWDWNADSLTYSRDREHGECGYCGIGVYMGVEWFRVPAAGGPEVESYSSNFGACNCCGAI